MIIQISQFILQETLTRYQYLMQYGMFLKRKICRNRAISCTGSNFLWYKGWLNFIALGCLKAVLLLKGKRIEEFYPCEHAIWLLGKLVYKLEATILSIKHNI